MYRVFKLSNFLHFLLGYTYTINVFGLKDDVCGVLTGQVL